MKIICKYRAGSHSYGLNTPSSDEDLRGIFLDTDISNIIGLNKFEQQTNQGNGVDEVFTEFRRALKLLRAGNTGIIELLYNKSWLELSPEWQMVIDNRERLVDSERLFSCLRGYMQGELRLANGTRTGALGSKRKLAIDRYSFSPKNFTQLFRLAWCGVTYFTGGHFPVNVKEESEIFWEFLMQVKTKPEAFTKEQLNQYANHWEGNLIHSYENRRFTTVYNEKLANNLCLDVYGPIINNAYSEYKRGKSYNQPIDSRENYALTNP